MVIVPVPVPVVVLMLGFVRVGVAGLVVSGLVVRWVVRVVVREVVTVFVIAPSSSAFVVGCRPRDRGRGGEAAQPPSVWWCSGMPPAACSAW